MFRYARVGVALLLVAGAIGGYWLGRQRSELPAVSAPEDRATCVKHRLPLSSCPFCNPAVAEASGWCAEHGVAEALCWICSPSIIAAYKAGADWCEEHGLPESRCALCNPGLVPAENVTEGTKEDSGVRLVFAPETPRSARSPSVVCTTGKQRVQFRSPEIARQAGLEFVRLEQRPVSEVLECNAESAYDGNHYARLSARAAGTIREVLRDVGDVVKAGDVLATIDSAELAAAKAEYLQALALVTLWDKNHARKHALLEQRIVSEKDDLEAENKLAESQIAASRAKERLRSLGLSEAQVADVAASNDTSSTLTVSAPFGGLVVERSAVIGVVINTTDSLFAVADTSRMWTMLDVYEQDTHKVRVGQGVVFEADGLPGESFGGRITWVSTRIDPKTRTLKARAEVDNTQGLLRANMFGRARVTIHDREPLLVVPKTAVQWDGCCNIAFVKLADALFEPRKLRLGCDVGEYYELKEGLSEGETVVTQGSFLLKTEIMKGSIGAGCCEPAGAKRQG